MCWFSFWVGMVPGILFGMFITAMFAMSTGVKK